MSTPTQPRPDTSARVVVPRPRAPMEAPVEPVAAEPTVEPTAGPTAGQAPARPGMFERYPWLTPACGIAMVIAAFTAMILLTWLAGGGSPFDR